MQPRRHMVPAPLHDRARSRILQPGSESGVADGGFLPLSAACARGRRTSWTRRRPCFVRAPVHRAALLQRAMPMRCRRSRRAHQHRTLKRRRRAARARGRGSRPWRWWRHLARASGRGRAAAAWITFAQNTFVCFSCTKFYNGHESPWQRKARQGKAGKVRFGRGKSPSVY